MKLRIIEAPNSHLKIEYMKQYGIGDTFIETGTYHGDTIWIALDAGFRHIHSIELNEHLYNNALKMFEQKPEVKLWLGDSIDCLKDIFATLHGPATFWLDAHASGNMPGGKSGGSPVLDELNLIKEFGIQTHTIFIDDRRLFGSAEWSGVKEEDAMKLIKEINPKYNIHLLDGHIEKDVVCATVVA